MARKFGMIGSTVWDSDKFLRLSSDSARLTYIYLCTTHHGNSVGVFKMPAAYLAVDRGKSKAEGQAELDELVREGLIETGEENQIRIRRWFYGPSGANSPSTGSSYAKVFMDPAQVRPGILRDHAAMEMMHASLEKARGWNPETRQLAQMHEDFGKLLRSMLREDHVQTLEACFSMGFHPADTVWDTMWDTVCHTMSPTVRTYIHGHLTPETDKDTGHRTRTPDTGQGERTRAKIAVPASAPPSLPAKGSQSGRGKVSEETAQKIASLGRCEACDTKRGYGDCPDCRAIKK